MTRLALLLLGCAASAVAAQDGPVASFEDGAGGTVILQNMTAAKPSEGAAEGSRYLSLTPTSDEPGVAVVRLRLGGATQPAGRAALSAAVRVTSSTAAAEKDIELRWLAIGQDKRPTFVRRFALKPGEQWVRLEEPLSAWRWEGQRVGDWDEVAELALVVESKGVARIDLDDVRFTGRTTADERERWLLDLAFGDRPREVAKGDGLLVATDAVEPYGDADLKRLLDDMRRARAFVRRAFGDAVRPTDEHAAPIALLIFSDKQRYAGLFERLGEQWRATVAPPRAQGYTIQDVAASTYEQKLGPRRPVYLHEAVHAIVARDVRLVNGHPPHGVLQEAVANFVQVCMHPESLDAALYVKAFAQEVDADGKGVFKPLEMLFAKPVTTREYAQLASVFGYLLEREPALLAALAKGLADGSTASDVLAQRRTTWAALHGAWLAWGRARFTPDRAKDAAIFDVPAELRE